MGFSSRATELPLPEFGMLSSASTASSISTHINCVCDKHALKNAIRSVATPVMSVMVPASVAQQVGRVTGSVTETFTGSVTVRVLQSLNPLPLVMAMANCVAWTTYGVLTDDWYLVIPNSLGCLIATFLFLVSYGLGMPDKRSRDMLSLAFMLLAVLLFVVTIIERMVVTSIDTKQKLWGYTGERTVFF